MHTHILSFSLLKTAVGHRPSKICARSLGYGLRHMYIYVCVIYIYYLLIVFYFILNVFIFVYA